ncbi:MAG: hypothetical protein ACRDWY_19180, partial [Actinomycetes bacterium]
MTDEQRRPDESPGGEAPWWSGSSRDVWNRPPESRESTGTGWPEAARLGHPGTASTGPEVPSDPW